MNSSCITTTSIGAKKPLPHFDRKAGHPGSHEETRDYIMARAETPVFAMDMSYDWYPG